MTQRRSNSLAGLVYMTLPEAYAKATGNGTYPTSARTLYYQVRPLLQQHTTRELTYAPYFAYNLLPAYQRDVGPLPLLYYDPRGELHEPHTRQVIQLGTREVASYTLPAWTYDKLLYVEKKGLWPVLQRARLAERYDLAVVVGEGQPVEAIRELCDRANSHAGYRVFVLHDADPYGYSIARTLAEETARMPGHHIDVTDLGLSVTDAINAGLPTEEFTRTRALAGNLTLTADELNWFTGQQTGARAWRCQRVELNAFTGPDLVTYIEDKLMAAGAAAKVVPPDDVLAREAAACARDALRDRAVDKLLEEFNIGRLADDMANMVAPQVVTDPRAAVAEAQDRDRGTWWKTAIQQAVDRRVDAVDGELEAALHRLLNY